MPLQIMTKNGILRNTNLWNTTTNALGDLITLPCLIQKKQMSRQNFFSPTRYSLLNTNEDNMVLEINTEINKSSPPPIFLTTLRSLFEKNLEQITKTEEFL